MNKAFNNGGHSVASTARVQPPHHTFHLNGFHIEPRACVLQRGGRRIKLEPQVMDLLLLLAARPGQVVSKAEITDALWPDRCVNEEALIKAVSKLRKALGDDCRRPQHIRTVPKKGYQLIPLAAGTRRGAWLRAAALCTALCLPLSISIWAWPLGGAVDAPAQAPLEGLFERAENHYYQYTRADNERAMRLYENILTLAPTHAPSQSGLANTLVQKVLRWPQAADQPEVQFAGLQSALASGRLDTPQARAQLQRAQGLAENAVRLAPGYARAHRALGLALSAQRHFEQARAAHRRAIALDPDAWGALINLAELQLQQADQAAALQSLQQAHRAMSRVYSEQAVQVRPWRDELAVRIAQLHSELQQPAAAETWYRRVLAEHPYHLQATLDLAALLVRQGEGADARRLCQDLKEKIAPAVHCDFTAPAPGPIGS